MAIRAEKGFARIAISVIPNADSSPDFRRQAV